VIPGGKEKGIRLYTAPGEMGILPGQIVIAGPSPQDFGVKVESAIHWAHELGRLSHNTEGSEGDGHRLVWRRRGIKRNPE